MLISKQIKAFSESKSFIQMQKFHTKHQNIILWQESKSDTIDNWQKNELLLKIRIENARYSKFAKNNIEGSIKTMRRTGSWYQPLLIWNFQLVILNMLLRNLFRKDVYLNRLPKLSATNQLQSNFSKHFPTLFQKFSLAPIRQAVAPFADAPWPNQRAVIWEARLPPSNNNLPKT